MPPRPVRRFTLIDAMILVAAAALGMAGIRAEMTPHLHPIPLYVEVPGAPNAHEFSASVGIAPDFAWLSGSNPPTSGFLAAPLAPTNWFSRLREWASTSRLVAPGLAALSVAMLLIRLRRPRPPWPRLVRRAGVAANLAATLALTVRSASVLAKVLLDYAEHGAIYLPSTDTGHRINRSAGFACQVLQPQLIGTVILVSWLALAVGGRCRCEPSWIDRAGIAVGSGWIGLFVLDLLTTATL